MLIIEVKDGIDKALKRYKRKFESTKILKQLRERKEFTKPSIKKRNEIKKAIHVKKKYG